MPASLWELSGRYTGIGSEMCRFTDRSDNKLVLGMTHEEAAVHLAQNTAKSYTQYPFMIYQIQTKFRDEPRARGGLIRVREFTMKDAYSFHTSQEDLEKYYERAYEAYNRIFKRCGLKNFVSVKSDSGIMGGKISHEYMSLTDIGEDTIVLCDCGYRSNLEVADSIITNEEQPLEKLKKVPTPGQKTIEAVCSFLGSDEKHSCKAVIYQENLTDDYVIVFTAAHEMAHQRGIAAEDEANFVAFLVCMCSDDAYIRYSGYQNMLEYIISALHTADGELYSQLMSQIDSRSINEIRAYNKFFETYRNSSAAEVSGAINDAYLKSQGQSAGEKSYGMVVDLAVAYYLDAE